MLYMLIVFDMDGVFIEEKSSWKLIHKTYGIDNSDIVMEYKMGKIDDEEFLNKDIARWREKGVKKQDIEQIFKNVPLTKGTEECIKFLKEEGQIAIISGGIDILARRIAGFGIDYTFANGIMFKKNVPWKGIIRVPIKEKEKILKNLMKELELKKGEVVVIGDTKYDIGMFKMAGRSIAFNPSPGVEKYADIVIKERNLEELIHIWKIY
ncbi:hypothetical protein B6U81_07530 [Thermoplasmatales archaeon ex4484_30]|nr:MAG: hypothetical protein B6U81_07530 [Thermoplasmatales archaeon ex4484_30]